MKHSLKITIILLLLFLLAQFFGIAILYKYVDHERSLQTGKTEFKDLPIGERPPLEEKTASLSIMIAVLVGTGIVFLLIRFNLFWIWKAWFFIAISMALTIAFGAFIPVLPAFILAAIVSLWKIVKPNFWVQNVTELFIYGGLAAMFVPLLSILSMSMLLVLIALYDAYAVWKSKHMVTLATSQAKAKIFAGLLVPYAIKRDVSVKHSSSTKQGTVPAKIRTALLGGGDIGFPLLFAGVVLKEWGLWQSLLIPFFSAMGLAYLLWKGDEQKFYPAMPFIGAGCFLGLGIVFLLDGIFL